MFQITLITMVLISFPEAMLIAALSLLIVGVKPTFKQLALIGVFQALFSYFVRLLPLDLNIIFLLQLIFSTINMYFIVSIPYSLSVIAELIGITIYMGIEAVSAMTLLHITGLSVQEIYASELLRLMFFLPQGVATILTIFLVNKFKVKPPDFFIDILKKHPKNLKKFFPLIVVMVAQTMVFSLIFSSNFLMSNFDFNNQDFFPMEVKIVFIIILLQLLLFLLIKKILGLLHKDIETQIELDSYRQIEDLINTVRAQKHNFCHDLQVTYGLMEVDEINEAKKYIKEAMEEISASNELLKSDNLSITALLQTKLGIAESKKIKMEFDLKSSMQQLPIPDRQLNIILGNLLDNAIEASEIQPIEKRKIAIEFSQEEEGYVFLIKSCGEISLENGGNLFNADYSTKGENRGIGLYSVKKSVQKYKGKIEVESINNNTIFRVWFPI